MTSPRSVLVVSSRRNPHTLFLFALQVPLGIAYLFTVPAPQSLAALVPGWLVMAWAVGLTLSGMVGVVSVWPWAVTTAMELERGALLASSGALLLIGGASLVVNGLRAIFGWSLILAWAAANLVRCRQIHRDVNQIFKAESRQE